MCLCVRILILVLFGGELFEMDVFSLEEDEYEGLFITQGSCGVQESSSNKGILGDPSDFKSPCGSVFHTNSTGDSTYEDISDSEDFQILCSQKQEPVSK